MKRILSICIACIMVLSMVQPVFAEETNDDLYEMVFEEEGSPIDNEFKDENTMVTPRTRYIMTVKTSAKYMGSNQVALHGDVLCNSTVKTISCTFYLQRYQNGSWVNVSTGSTSVSNANKLSKTATVSGVASGTYRAKCVGRVTDSNGYSESVTGYSGSMSF